MQSWYSTIMMNIFMQYGHSHCEEMSTMSKNPIYEKKIYIFYKVYKMTIHTIIIHIV